MTQKTHTHFSSQDQSRNTQTTQTNDQRQTLIDFDGITMSGNEPRPPQTSQRKQRSRVRLIEPLVREGVIHLVAEMLVRDLQENHKVSTDIVVSSPGYHNNDSIKHDNQT